MNPSSRLSGHVGKEQVVECITATRDARNAALELQKSLVSVVAPIKASSAAFESHRRTVQEMSDRARTNALVLKQLKKLQAEISFLEDPEIDMLVEGRFDDAVTVEKLAALLRRLHTLFNGELKDWTALRAISEAKQRTDDLLTRGCERLCAFLDRICKVAEQRDCPRGQLPDRSQLVSALSTLRDIYSVVKDARPGLHTATTDNFIASATAQWETAIPLWIQFASERSDRSIDVSDAKAALQQAIPPPGYEGLWGGATLHCAVGGPAPKRQPPPATPSHVSIRNILAELQYSACNESTILIECLGGAPDSVQNAMDCKQALVDHILWSAKPKTTFSCLAVLGEVRYALESCTCDYISDIMETAIEGLREEWRRQSEISSASLGSSQGTRSMLSMLNSDSSRPSLLPSTVATVHYLLGLIAVTRLPCAGEGLQCETYLLKETIELIAVAERKSSATACTAVPKYQYILDAVQAHALVALVSASPLFESISSQAGQRMEDSLVLYGKQAAVKHLVKLSALRERIEDLHRSGLADTDIRYFIPRTEAAAALEDLRNVVPRLRQDVIKRIERHTVNVPQCTGPFVTSTLRQLRNELGATRSLLSRSYGADMFSESLYDKVISALS